MQQIRQRKGATQEYTKDNLVLSLGMFDIKLNIHIHIHQAGSINCVETRFSLEKNFYNCVMDRVILEMC